MPTELKGQKSLSKFPDTKGIPTYDDKYMDNIVDRMEENQNFILLRQSESFFDGLQRMAQYTRESDPEHSDPYLLNDSDNNATCCARYVVNDGATGVATKFGKTHFIRPGSYFTLGLGVDNFDTRNLIGQSPNRQTQDHALRRWNFHLTDRIDFEDFRLFIKEVPGGTKMTPGQIEAEFASIARSIEDIITFNQLRQWWSNKPYSFKEDPNIATGTVMKWKEISYVCLPENSVAVIQQDENQKIIASGRFILRDPIILYGIVDLSHFENAESVQSITEEASNTTSQDGHVLDVQKKVRLKAGEWQKTGAITFIRPETGFCFVVQNSEGGLRTGIGFDVARKGEVFQCFVDQQHYARTSRQFHLESKLGQEVLVRVQLRWRLENAARWLQRQGASADIFDALEEMAQSLLRDAVASHTYEECQSQAGEGYEGIEKQIRGVLEYEAGVLGGTLLGMEIRELRFPLLERRNVALAQKEARLKELVLEEERQLRVETAQRATQASRRATEQSRSLVQQQHLASVAALRAKEKVAAEERRKELQSKKLQNQTVLEMKVLENKLNQLKLQLETEEKKARVEAEQALSLARLRNENRISEAKAHASIKVKQAEAESDAKKTVAESKAESASALGRMYENKQLLDLELSKLNARVLEARTAAVQAALTHNPGALMPLHMQRELAVLKKGFSPVVPVLLQNGQSVGGLDIPNNNNNNNNNGPFGGIGEI